MRSWSPVISTALGNVASNAHKCPSAESGDRPNPFNPLHHGIIRGSR